jgi:hypothetical protein
MVNALFGEGNRRAVAFLRRVRQLFPQSLVFVQDYFGQLGSGHRTGALWLIHDVAQVTSGQGVPPSTRQEWFKVYRAAGFEPVQGIEGTRAGFKWFVHVLINGKRHA